MPVARPNTQKFDAIRTSYVNLSSEIESNKSKVFDSELVYDKQADVLYIKSGDEMIEMGRRPTVPYDIGDYWITESTIHPETRWAGTTWTRIVGQFLYGSSSGADVGTTGGEATVNIQPVHLPPHTHDMSHDHPATVTSSAGTHSHTRGTQNITGTIITGGHTPTGTGAFINGTDTSTKQSNDGGHTDSRTTYFDASRTWTGDSSTEPDHTHTLDIPAFNGLTSSVGSGNALPILPPYRKVNIWLRTS